MIQCFCVKLLYTWPWFCKGLCVLLGERLSWNSQKNVNFMWLLLLNKCQQYGGMVERMLEIWKWWLLQQIQCYKYLQKVNHHLLLISVVGYWRQTALLSSSDPKEKNHSGQNRAFASNKKAEKWIASQINFLPRQGQPCLLKNPQVIVIIGRSFVLKDKEKIKLS